VTPSNGGSSNSNSNSNSSSSSNGDGDGNGNGNGGRSNAGVTAILTHLPSAEQPGIASILIPLSSAAAGEGFKFSLPQELVAAMGSSGAAASVSSLNGEALPSWLRFDADSRNFVANAVPAGALPYQVRITVGGQITVIMMGAASD
jgi:hypothetical protein